MLKQRPHKEWSILLKDGRVAISLEMLEVLVESGISMAIKPWSVGVGAVAVFLGLNGKRGTGMIRRRRLILGM